ncbi:uncharacterized protein LOC134303716 [Trichomycterus rosablanca]|uniref:uncharacterized protein LOC134303716 n=1 Tax=Trichomycterus rosablanca TaxID=2290929 RepID=UPI002F35950C
MSSLSPNTKYTFSVCALGPRGAVSSCSSVIAQTADGQDHAPRGLTVAVLGCHELHVSWSAPAVPHGHLFTYELLLNEHVVYQGTGCKHTARHLNANTSYTCTVTAVTSRGSFQSWPVTKRTAKKEYVKTNRHAYSTKHQHLALPPIREVSEVKTKSRKSFSPYRQLPEVQLTTCHDTIFSHRKNKQLKSWKYAEKKSNVNISPMNSERTARPQHRSPDLIQTRPKISQATLLQWEADRRVLDKVRPHRISSQIAGKVRPLQPVSYNWSDLDQTKDHHRNRCKKGSRMHNSLKGRHYITSNWTKV